MNYSLLRKAVLTGVVIAALSTVLFQQFTLPMWIPYLGISAAVLAGTLVYLFGAD